MFSENELLSAFPKSHWDLDLFKFLRLSLRVLLLTFFARGLAFGSHNDQLDRAIRQRTAHAHQKLPSRANRNSIHLDHDIAVFNSGNVSRLITIDVAQLYTVNIHSRHFHSFRVVVVVTEHSAA